MVAMKQREAVVTIEAATSMVVDRVRDGNEGYREASLDVVGLYPG